MSCRYVGMNNQDDSLVAKTKYRILRDAAKSWIDANPDKDPQFSACGTMIFDENEAAEDIGKYMIGQAAKAGFEIVSPREIVAAVFTVKAWMTVEDQEKMPIDQ